MQVALMLNNNACPHVVQPAVDLFIDHSRETLRHAPYSPDLSPSDFGLFPELKEPLRKTHFGSLKEFLLVVTREICISIKNNS